MTFSHFTMYDVTRKGIPRAIYCWEFMAGRVYEWATLLDDGLPMATIFKASQSAFNRTKKEIKA